MFSQATDFEVIKQKRADLYAIVFSQAFSPCGNYLAACNNFGRIAVFSVSNALDINAVPESRHPVNVFQAEKSSIYSLTSTLTFLISAGVSQISGWKWKDVIQCREPRPSWTLHLPSSTPFDVPETNGLAYNSQSNTLISGGGDNLIYIWDLETGACKTKLAGHTDYIHCVAVLETSNRCISGAEDGCIKIWDCRASNSLISTLEPTKDPFEVVVHHFHHYQESILSGCFDGQSHWTDVSSEPLSNEKSSNGNRLLNVNARRPDVGKWISCLAVDNNEQWMVCGGGPHLSCWHLGSSTLTSVLPTPASCQLSSLFYEDKILSGGTDSKVYHWSVNGEKKAEVPSTARSIYSLAINFNSSRNKVLSVAGESTDIDVCTNFNYQAFCFKFKSK